MFANNFNSFESKNQSESDESNSLASLSVVVDVLALIVAVKTGVVAVVAGDEMGRLDCLARFSQLAALSKSIDE